MISKTSFAVESLAMRMTVAAFGARSPSMFRRLTRRWAVVLTVSALLAVPGRAAADPGDGEDPAQAEYRFSFAQSYVGLSLSFAPSPGKINLTPTADTSDEFDLPTMLAPRIVLGGLHFWAHADLYVAFSPVWFRTSEPRGIDTRFNLGVETGAKIYPWALSPGTIRPFAGIAWSVNNYRQDDGPRITIHQMPVMIGAAWRTSRGIFEVGASLHVLGDRDYPLGRDADEQARFVPEVLDVWLGYRYEFDTTASFIEESRSGRLAKRYQAFESENRLSAWEIALGPSAAFPLSDNEFIGQGAFLSGLRRPVFLPDLAVGYYIHSIDAALRANYRFFYSSDEGYGRTHTYVRHSMSFDALKFIFDYHGFLPFLGAGVSLERLDYDVRDDVVDEHRSVGAYKAAASVVLGWDIRPSETGAWLLRTNLRFTPALDLQRGGEQIAFDHFEFNFIQLVLYPERFF